MDHPTSSAWTPPPAGLCTGATATHQHSRPAPRLLAAHHHVERRVHVRRLDRVDHGGTVRESLLFLSDAAERDGFHVLRPTATKGRWLENRVDTNCK